MTKASHTLRGSVVHQVQTLFNTSGIRAIGESKHAAKEGVRTAMEAQGKGVTWHEMGKQIKIYSYNYADNARDTWTQAFKYARETFGLRNIQDFAGGHARRFLEEKIDQGVTMSTLQTYAAHLEKLEVALNLYSGQYQTGNEYYFSSEIAAARFAAREEGLAKVDGTRAYTDPRALVMSIPDGRHRLVAQLQYEGGLRIREASEIHAHQLLGLREHPDFGKVGVIQLEKGDTKGGKPREAFVSEKTYEALTQCIKDGNGLFKIFDKDGYRRDLKAAAVSTSQNYTGSHGLRHSFAQECMRFFGSERGMTYEESLLRTSQIMGHERPDITETYLR